MYSLQQQIKHSTQDLPPVAAIIVLGSGTVDGKPTPTLASRLDTAAQLIEQQPQALIITSAVWAMSARAVRRTSWRLT
ncbi:YdcF family protein [Psychrobacter celer]